MSEIKERWCFTDKELDDPSKCLSSDIFIFQCPYDEEDEADMPSLETWRERGIMVDRKGMATNFYADGTRGVSQYEKDLIDGGDVDAYTSLQVPADRWRDVITDEGGNFIRFA